MKLAQLKNISALMLTPNHALAQRIKTTHPQANSKSLRQWLHQCWQQLKNKPTLLSNFQERQIWHNIIEHSSHGRILLNIPAAAKLAQQAFQLHRKWQLPLLTKNVYFTEEVNQFSEWIASFGAYCQAHQVSSSMEIIPLLSATQVEFAWPKEIILLNFDNINTQIKQFLAKLPCKISFIELEESAVVKCIGFANAQAELAAMTQWVKQQVQLSPTQKIQCVVPDLNARRVAIERAFKSANIASFQMMDTALLTQVPLIKAALLILNLNTTYNPIDRLTQLLLSRFIDGADLEMYSRARLDAHLREMALPWISWQTLFTAEPSIKNPLLLNILKKYLALRKELANQLHNLATWQDTFSSLLMSLGWPGEPTTLNCEEIRHRKNWQDLLAKFITLPLLEQKISYQTALNLLERLAQETKLDLEVIDSPVRIMGLREAATLPCDARWIVGMHAQAWPEPVQINPFLPYRWQTEYQLPHSNAENEFTFAKRLTGRLSRSAKHVIFSYATQNEGQNLTISPLLQNLPHETMDTLPIMDQALALFSARDISLILDDAPTLKNKETLTLRGGSALLRAQAACPFQAFARYRLAAKPVAHPNFNLSPSERGQLLHHALELIWQQLQSHAALLIMEEQQLDRIVQSSVRDAMKKNTLLLQKFSFPWRTLEEMCLIRLLATWLAEEKKRPPFTVIAREQRQAYEIGGLKLNLSLDRIDQLADGSQVIIDYKTGAQNLRVSDWFGERPKDPQLPLYCLAHPEICGSIIAQVRLRVPKLIGITAKSSYISGVIDVDWQHTVDAWHTVLTQLAEQFVAGVASVNPRDKDVCTYCDLHSLCRIQAAQETIL